MENEPHGPEDISERLIPEIPGVIHPQDEESDWGALSEDPDEESQEDIIEEVGKEVKAILNDFGVEGVNSASQEEITRLWSRMGMSTYLIGDLALYSTIEIQDRFKSQLRRPRFKDLKERSEITENPFDVRIKLIESVAPNLITLGYSALNAYRLPRTSNEDLAMAFKAEGWLAGLFFMKDLPTQLNAHRADSKNRKLTRSQVFKITQDEIVRQAKVTESDMTKRLYDSRLTSNQEAYGQLLKTIKTAYRVADFALSKFIIG